MTGYEPQGTMGRVQTAGEAVSLVVSFPPSFARTFSSKERRLGTRQGAYSLRSRRRLIFLVKFYVAREGKTRVRSSSKFPPSP